MFPLYIPTHFSEHYQVLVAGGAEMFPSGEVVSTTDAARLFSIVTHELTIPVEQWRGVLMRLGISIPAHFFHAADIYHEVVKLCLRGQLRLVKIPRLEQFSVIAAGDGWGYCFMRSSQPHPSLSYLSINIASVKDADVILNKIKSTDKELYRSIHNNPSLAGLLKDESNIRARLAELLANKEVQVYKVPVRGAAPTVKAVEYLPATAADKPVPLAPETKASPAVTNATSTEQPGPKSLADCAQCLGDARKKLDAEGYTAKYTDAQQLQKVQEGAVSKERFLVSFQTKSTNPDTKLAFERDSGLAPVWATSFDQLENADTDPQLIADILGTPYDPSKEYVLHIIDRGETFNQFGQNTLIPTWDNMQEPTQKYLGGKHDPAVLAEVMTPEYQRQYTKDIEQYHAVDLNEFDKNDQKDYAETLSTKDREKFLARHNVRTEIGANSEFTGNGLTQSREGSTHYGVVETLTLENNPPSITKMSNVKTIALKPRGLV